MVCIYITISLPSIHIYSFKKKVLLEDDIKRYAKQFCKTSKNKSKNRENLTCMSKVHIMNILQYSNCYEEISC